MLSKPLSCWISAILMHQVIIVLPPCNKQSQPSAQRCPFQSILHNDLAFSRPHWVKGFNPKKATERKTLQQNRALPQSQSSCGSMSSLCQHDSSWKAIALPLPKVPSASGPWEPSGSCFLPGHCQVPVPGRMQAAPRQERRKPDTVALECMG